MYPVHPYRLATVMRPGPWRDTAIRTIEGSCGKPTCIDYGIGWQQGVMNVALLGLAQQAAAAVSARAATPTGGGVRFPAYVASFFFLADSQVFELISLHRL